MPTGMLTGESIVLPTASETISNKAPVTAEKGRRNLWSLPTSIRAIWGATSPTKPITPVKLITADVIKTEAIHIIALIFSGFKPSVFTSSSSPEDIALSLR